MRLTRLFVAVALLAVGGLSIYRLVYEPWRCQITKRSVKKRTEILYSSPETLSSLGIARENISRLNRCLPVTPADIDLYMLLAANYRLVRNYAAAADTYRKALAFDERPEIYLSLGLAELELGQRSAALEHLTLACTFNFLLIDDIPDPQMRIDAINGVRAREDRIVRNAGRR